MSVSKKKTTKKKAVVKKKEKPEGYIFGRPTTYDISFCQIVIDKMSEGYSKEAVAGHLSISKTTLYDWITKHKDFANAISIGETKSQMHWEGSLVKHVVHTKNGKQINGQVFNLNMKNRFGWRDKNEVDIGNKDGDTFKFAFDLSDKPEE